MPPGGERAIMDVGDWLRSLGLEQYEAAFRDNAIDASILPSLTAEDFKELGIGTVGHRRKLLDAIAALRVDAKAKQPASDAASLADRPATDTAERRQVTVMFCDLVGSTALAARMDPEDLREVISAYQKCVAETVRRFGGFVAKYMGDGVLVYFGYPQAHEDDAERAVRAGLELVAAVVGIKTRAPLQTRIGIATGMVVVGDQVGSGETQERGIVGETPNLAARLQDIAEPNMVIIAEGTRKLLGNLFDLRDLGARQLKGIAGPARAWAALRASPVASRFEAMHAATLTALVGREEETELLLRRWAKAKTGEGQVVLLSGEAGIGKSRLTAALLERLANERHTRLRYFCSPQHTDSALYPIIGQMQRASGLARDDAPQAKLDKLDAMLALTSTSREDAALFAEMLSLPNDGRYAAPVLTAEQRRQRTLDALIAQIEALTRQRPLLIIFEDVQWIDPTSLEALGWAVDHIRTLPVLVLVTFRPEFTPPWIGRPYVTALTINRLGEREVAAMIDRVAGSNALTASLRQDIIERTDGIPLFVEEMTKAVLEAASEGDAQKTTAAVPSPRAVVPPSLHASLMARLDRLGSAKEVAQIGAAIGREFSHALLAAVVRKPDDELDEAIERLMRSGLLFRQGAPPYATYLFKHALVQDAAYGTLLREPRRALHARIAETLESQFPDVAETQPELLARHCTEAGQIEKAARLWGKAGQQSLMRSALVEAAEQLTRALAQIATLPATPALRREQIKLQVALLTPLIHVKGYAAPEMRAATERARMLIEQAEALGEPPDDPLLLFMVLWCFWGFRYVEFNGAAMRELAAQFLARAEKLGAPVPLMIGHRIMGNSLMLTGDVTEGRPHLDKALALYDPAEHRLLATRFGQDPLVAILSYRPFALWLLGYADAALKDSDAAVRAARELGQAGSLMYALYHATMPNLLCGNYATAAAQTGELLALAEEKRSPHWKAAGTINRGLVTALSGKTSEGVQLTTAGMVAYRTSGSTNWRPLRLSYLAMMHAQLGQFDDASRCIGDAIMAIETTDERWCEPEAYRAAGEIALLSGGANAAEAQPHFERALAVARKQKAKSWELRAAMSLARLWRDQGKRDDARNLLAPVYGWFTEGFETLGLKEAKALLDTLAS